jgi:hypothetical protein
MAAKAAYLAPAMPPPGGYGTEGPGPRTPLYFLFVELTFYLLTPVILMLSLNNISLAEFL